MKLQEIHDCAMQLPEAERAALEADLLYSLPSILVDDDDGIQEAQRRSSELANHPSVGCSWAEIRSELGR
jgi:hypothetical protein